MTLTDATTSAGSVLLDDVGRFGPPPTQVAAPTHEAPRPERGPAIEFRNVSTQYAGHWVLKGVSFGAPEGKITALLGASGGGKTTLVKHLLSLHRPDGGDVLVEGRSVIAMKEKDRLKLHRRFGVVLQGSGVFGSALWESMTVLDNLLHQLHTLRPDLKEADLHRISIDRLREVGMAEHMASAPSMLSAGQQKRVALARALISEPEFAVLDSFDMGIDGVRLAGVRELIRRQHGMWGGTYLIVTHNVQLVHSLADHVVVIHGGEIVEEGTTEEVFASPHPAVEQLLDGAIDGPLTMASGWDIPEPRSHRELVDVQPEFFPLPLAILILLFMITAGTFALGKSTGAFVYFPLGLLWVIAVPFLAWYEFGEGSARSNRRKARARAAAEAGESSAG